MCNLQQIVDTICASVSLLINNEYTYLLGLLQELSEFIHIKHLELLWQYLDLCKY